MGIFLFFGRPVASRTNNWFGICSISCCVHSGQRIKHIKMNCSWLLGTLFEGFWVVWLYLDWMSGARALNPFTTLTQTPKTVKINHTRIALTVWVAREKDTRMDMITTKWWRHTPARQNGGPLIKYLLFNWSLGNC